MGITYFVESVWQFGLLFLAQSTLLILLAFLVVRLCRLGDAAVLSVVYRSTMLAVLVSPLVTMAMMHSHVDGWWPAEPAQQSVAQSSGSGSSELLPTQTDWTPAADEPLQEQPQAVFSEPFVSMADDQATARPEGLPSDPGRNALAGSEPSVEPSQASGPLTRSWQFVGKSAFVAVWLVVSFYLLIRHLRAYRSLQRSLRRSVPAHAEIQQLCDRMAEELNVNPPRVVCSPYFDSPFLTGIRDPVIHLSSEDEIRISDNFDGNVRDVLAHELAHLKRHDVLVAMLNHVALSLFFFQPLLWRLVVLIEGTAEDVCDDYAVGLGASREGYARRLVDLAERCDFPLGSAVGIASGNSMLKHRVMRIMDSGRSLSIQAGVATRLSAATISFAAVLIAAMSFTPETIVAAAPPVESVRPDEKTEDASKPAAQPVPIVESSVDEVPLSVIRGTILGGNGPLAGAEVYWWRSRVYDDAPMQPVRVVTDQNGTFELKRTPPSADQVAIWDMREEMVIRAEGYAFERTSPRKFGALTAIEPDRPGQNAQLPGPGEPVQLNPEGPKVSGRLIDIDGQPIAGASVRIRWFSKRWFRIRNGGIVSSRPVNPEPDTEEDRIRDVASVVNSIPQVPLLDALPKVNTDTEGRFQLNELPADCFFELLVERSGFESTNLVVRNDGGNEAVTVPQEEGFDHNPPTKLYPPEFDAVIGPASAVIGKITDVDTGLPIVGALVQTNRVNNQRVTSTRERQHWMATTDAAGNYRIDGLPAGDGNQFLAHGPRTLPYIPTAAKADESNRQKSVNGTYQIDFQLKQGVWAEGRAYDANTDEPFQGSISYYWFRNRELEAKYAGCSQARLDGRNFTDSIGHYRIPVLPTPGVIAFSTENRDHARMSVYSRGYGEFDLAKYRSPDGKFPYYDTNPTYLMPGNYNRLALVDPQPNEDVMKADLPIAKANPIAVTILNPDGQPATAELEIYGGNERFGWRDKQPQGFVVEDLLPDQRRKVFAFDRSRGLIGGVIVEHGEGKEFTIKLAAAGRVHGRLIDKDDTPITDVTISMEYSDFQSDDDTAMWANVEGKHYAPTEILVGNDGRFEVLGMSPQWKYSARVESSNRFIGQAFRALVIQAGEDRDLGNITIEKPSD